MKKLVKSVLALLALNFIMSLQAQTIESEKATLYVNNKPEEATPVAATVTDNTPPTITITSADLQEGIVFQTEEPKLLLLGKVDDESGVSYTAVNGQLVEVSDEGVFMDEIELMEGMNEIKVIAADKANNPKRVVYEVEYHEPIKTLADKVLEESKYYALIIGIEDYVDPDITDLDRPVDDARELKDILTKYYTFEDDDVTLLENPTYQQMMIAFDDLSRKSTEKDNVLIFYAGHGNWDEQAQIGYWLPADASDSNTSFWFRNSTLKDYVNQIKSQHTLLISDACFSGSIFKTRSPFKDADKGVEILYDLTSRKAMTSGTLKEVPDQSEFVKYLVNTLKDNDQQYLTSAQLYNSFNIVVTNLTEIPPQWGVIGNTTDNGGDFIFIKRPDVK